MESQSNDAMLAAAERGRAAATRALRAPWWYASGIGVLTAAFSLTFVFGTPFVRSLAVLPLLGIGALLQAAYRRSTGMWVSGTRNGVASIWMFAWVALAIGSMLLSEHLWTTQALVWPAIAAAALIIGTSILCWRLFERTLARRSRQATRQGPDGA